ncbi:hypothetical protein K443DRAFT_125471 [Laccaria amethystina LaAM-08-1]|uniref:Unplaced genomic scaffold K443scaffold_289, whole genome shotgun sequence n=1 Tax=Laccaria amethystina LaAM-08-1 TaxID=1095629 RepID=A0A0C9WIZ1_9AGAR|nr:hypothetical protein K443DRAFT_125471 [Laccaria amethystina LaAM-08-1]
MSTKNLERTAEEDQTRSVQAKRVREAKAGLDEQTPTSTPKAQLGMPIDTEATKVMVKEATVNIEGERTKKKLKRSKLEKKAETPSEPQATGQIAGSSGDKSIMPFMFFKREPIEAPPSKAFERFTPPKELTINFYHHLGPYGPILAKGNPSLEILKLLQENVHLKVLATIIGAFKNKEAVIPFPKVVNKQRLLWRREMFKFTFCRIVPVLFRAIEGSYKPIRSIAIKGIEEKKMEVAFKRWLCENVVKKIIRRVPLVDKSHNSAEIDKRPIWIVEPKVQDGDLDMRICPLDTTSRWGRRSQSCAMWVGYGQKVHHVLGKEEGQLRVQVFRENGSEDEMQGVEAAGQVSAEDITDHCD